MENNREKFIGGSDAAGVLGLSRWATPLSVWAEKTGQVKGADISDKVCVKLGNKLEQTVAELFTEETGKRVRRSNEMIVHPRFDFIVANIDRRIVGENSILECKTCSAWKAKEWESEEIPQEYIIQCVHYLAVTGAKMAYIAVLIGNQDFKLKSIARDETMIKELIEKEVYFWNTFVTPKIMPTQISCADSPTLLSLFPNAEENTEIELGEDINQMVDSLNAYKEDSKSIEGHIEQLENVLKSKIKENEIGVTSRFKIYWGNTSRTSLDAKAIKENEPEFYSKYSKKTASRRFTIKLKKE